ncbi:MAG: GrpB family protein [Longimicrobiales bacterium]
MTYNPPKTWIVVPYRPEWPGMFAHEAGLVARVFHDTDAVVEHIGSTAVPGLGAKPIIDIMIGLTTLADAERRIEDLAQIDYEYVPEYEAELPDRRYFRKPFLRPRSHHLHIVRLGSDFWTRHLLFRDYLRAHPETAAAYYELKQLLALQCNATGADYTEGKSPFVAHVLELASRYVAGTEHYLAKGSLCVLPLMT